MYVSLACGGKARCKSGIHEGTTTVSAGDSGERGEKGRGKRPEGVRSSHNTPIKVRMASSVVGTSLSGR